MHAADHAAAARATGSAARPCTTILGNRIAPWLADRYLARTGIEGQQTDQPADEHRKHTDYLFEPVPGDHGAHGSFDDEAKPRSPQAVLSRHRGAAAAGAGRRRRRRSGGAAAAVSVRDEPLPADRRLRADRRRRTAPRWSRPTARSTGAACRASTPARCFGRLLDGTDGGHCYVRPTAERPALARATSSDTLVLETDVDARRREARVFDFMSIAARGRRASRTSWCGSSRA